MNLVTQWLIDNKLSLHLGKTESILFGSKQKLKSKPNLNITCNDTSIDSSTSVKYLGVNIDQHLHFCSLAENIIKKANARLKFLYRKNEFLTEQTKKLLVMSLIQCHFDYACSVWYSGLTQFLKNKLQTTQNKMIRFVLNLDCRTSITAEHFKLLKWLPVQKRVEQIILCHVFKVKNNLAPVYLCESFITQDTIHSHSTRLSKKGGFAIPTVKGVALNLLPFLDQNFGILYHQKLP